MRTIKFLLKKISRDQILREILEKLISNIEDWRADHDKIHRKEDSEIRSLSKDLKKLKVEVNRIKDDLRRNQK